jgi:thiol:disulfide interchange protein DsbD
MRFFAALLLFFSCLAQAQDGEFLDPEEAYRFSAHAIDANSIEVRYRIADGYYMYRKKFRFDVEGKGVVLGTALFPPGKMKHDDNFGEMETYRNEVRIKLPLTRSGDGAQRITLKATSQGCADAGLCYNPIEQIAELKLPALAAASGGASSEGALSALKRLVTDLGGGSGNDFLPPDQAFKLAVNVRDKGTLLADFTIARDYYLYRDKTIFTLQDAGGTTIAKVDFPKPEIKTDPNFGEMSIYHEGFQAAIRLAGAPADKLVLAATYQGCSSKGICYAPITKTFNLSLAGAAQAAPPTSAATAPAPESESFQIENLFKGGSFWLVVASFFGFGLLLALTPCVFPMIPILSGIIVGQGRELTKMRGLALSAAYVLGMAVTYAAAGVAAGLSGSMLSAALQNPWVLSGFAMVFVALSFSMFGFYELQLPSFLQSKFSDASNRMKGGKLTGVFVMGVFSAVIIGPCVAAPLAGALLYIGQTHDVWLGGSALFAMALGMGVPLLLVGLSAGALLPRAGGWMSAVKSFFGVLLLAVAIWLISPVISPLVHMLLWSALLIVSAIYLHAIDPLPHTASGFARFWKGVGVITLLFGVALLVGALSGGRDILQPLSGLRGGSAVAGELAADAGHTRFERVKSVAELEARIKQAGGRTVMLDFFADWCVSCKEMERFTFQDPRVAAKLGEMVLLQVNVVENNADDKALLKKFGLFGPPGIIFFDKDGNENKAARVIGYQAPERFLQSLAAAAP